ncbi:hypothetical protein J3R30DRAFT_1384812 [Lentinula aciculospora]|uniref:Uncharacterized protein n=1 Tax=Lentinula aciculospora TaxID=153920 RepID=A0A9W9DTT5_9AGAR|nr:hypothetical protein J3R30DRAFT_1384812 [Lentinula aciculospora]
MESTQKALVLLQEKLANAVTELGTSTKHLQTVQNEAKIAKRRAEDAEKTQKELQEEGTILMHSLDEMRPKIVELTGIKLELTEKAEELERVIQTKETVIEQLESSSEEIRADFEASEKRLRDLLSERETERSSTQDSDSELQKAYNQIQAELDLAFASIKSLEADRTIRQNEALRHIEEVARLQELATAQSEELRLLQHEIYQRQNDQVCVPRKQNRILWAEVHPISRRRSLSLKLRRTRSSLYVKRIPRKTRSWNVSAFELRYLVLFLISLIH